MHCEHCGLVHDSHTPEWRDCRQQQFVKLASEPDKWKFNPTPAQIERVRQAAMQFKTEYGGIPNIQQINMLIGQQFSTPVEYDEQGPGMDVVAMTTWWDEFTSDMPEVMRTHAGVLNSLNGEWSQRKIFKILDDLKLSYIDWELDEVSAHLNSPGHLRHVASKMEMMEAHGYSLYDRTDPADDVVTWYFRRAKPKNV